MCSSGSIAKRNELHVSTRNVGAMNDALRETQSAEITAHACTRFTSYSLLHSHQLTINNIQLTIQPTTMIPAKSLLFLALSAAVGAHEVQCSVTCGTRGALRCGSGILNRPISVMAGGQEWCCPKGIHHCSVEPPTPAPTPDPTPVTGSGNAAGQKCGW
jgi:hypothetical protein